VAHVVWIVMENKGFDRIIGAPEAPYINQLASAYGLATDMSAETHPSLPNYIALVSGSTQGITDDHGPSTHPLSAPTIFGQLAGDWRALQESMPENCARKSGGDYLARHNPAVYFTPLAAECATRDVRLTMPPDLSARLTFVTPDLCHDMHASSCGPDSEEVRRGDAWLADFVPLLLSSPEYREGSTVIVITWDESDDSSSNRIPTIVISPRTHGVRDGTAYTHFSILRTTEELLGLPLLGAAESAPSMRPAFGL
jgi:hypothetical protein